MGNGEREMGMGNGEWEMENGECYMENGEWEIEIGKLKLEEKLVSVLLEWAELRFFGDGRMWVLVEIDQLNMEGKNILIGFFFFFVSESRKERNGKAY